MRLSAPGLRRRNRLKEPGFPWPASRTINAMIALVAALAMCADASHSQSPSPVDDQRSTTNPKRQDFCVNDAWVPIYARCNVKLGFPKEEAALLLSERQRQLLDGVLRLYSEADLLADRKQAIAIIGGEIAQTRLVPKKWLDGKTTFSRSDSLKGLYLETFFRDAINTYTYSAHPPLVSGESRYTWQVIIQLSGDYKRECLPSRAVEGYLDIPLTSRIFNLIPPRPRNRWDRHGPGGHVAAAWSISRRHPNLTVGFAEGCLTGFYFDVLYRSEELSDAKIHD